MAHSHTANARLQSLGILAVAAAVLYFVRDVFIPLAFALILTFLLSPIVDRLRRLRLGRVPAALSALTLSFLLVGAAVGIVMTELVDVADKLPNYQQNIARRLAKMRGSNVLGQVTRGVKSITRELSNDTSTQPDATEGAPSSTQKPVPVQVITPPESEWTTIRGFLGPILGPIGMAGVVLVFTAFILLRREDVRDRLIKLAGISKISVTTRALEDAEDRVGHYLRFALLINSCFGCIIALGLWLIGLPTVALWGIIAALMRFVPYAGILISCACPLLLSLAIFPGWEKPVFVVLLFFVPEVLIANVIEPVVYGANTGTSPLGLLVAAVFWTVLWGPLGLVLSTPLTVCVVVLGRHVPQLSFLHVLLAEETGLTDEARLYGRLLAADRNEAQRLVDEVLAEKTLVETYDDLLIPVLRLAEQDRHKGALEPPQADSIFEGLKQIITEVGNRLEAERDSSSEAAHLLGKPPSLPEAPLDTEQQITCMAVMDEADEISATMLAQVLERHHCPCVHLGPGNSREWIGSPDDVIFLVAVPPFASMSTRRHCARIRRQLPSSTIVVGMWGAVEEPEAIKKRFGSANPDYVVTRLADALELVAETLGG